MTIRLRIKRIEGMAGLADGKSYLFIHIVRPHNHLSNEREYKKDDFEGPVILIEKNRGWIDAFSQEGKTILEDYGYKP